MRRRYRRSATGTLFSLAMLFVLTGCRQAAGPAAAAGPVADFAVTNGKIVTVDNSDTIAQAIAVKSGRIIAIGTNDAIRPLIAAQTVVVDARGRTVVPGMIDSHGHHVSTSMSDAVNVDLSPDAGVKSIADLQDKIAAKVKTVEKGASIRGVREDDFKMAEKRHPTRFEIDTVAPDNPVSISTVGGHFSIVNSKALELAGVTKNTPDPLGGRFGKDPKTGELNGWLYERASGVVTGKMPPSPPLTEERRQAAVKAMMLDAAAKGLTCVYDSSSSGDFRTVLEMKRKGEQPIRFRGDLSGQAAIDAESAIGMTYRGMGDEWVKLVGVKFVMDGAISARTAYLTEDYLNQPGFKGVLATSREEAKKIIEGAWKAGLKTSVHANGDATLNMYLDIIEELRKTYPRVDTRDVIVHCTVVNPAIIARIKALDLYPTIFGPYIYYHGDKILPAFGEKRLEYMFAARSFLDAGVRVAAHSDYSASPYIPLMAIQGLVTRTSSGGKPIGPSQKISVPEALKLWTINGAYQTFDENDLGSLEVGKLGDMVVLGQDLLTVPANTIIDIPVDMTVVGGKVVFERKTM